MCLSFTHTHGCGVQAKDYFEEHPDEAEALGNKLSAILQVEDSTVWHGIGMMGLAVQQRVCALLLQGKGEATADDAAATSTNGNATTASAGHEEDVLVDDEDDVLGLTTSSDED